MTTRQDALIVTAKAAAPHVVSWVADREPLGYLLGNRTNEELTALVVVLAEALGDEAGRERLARVCAAPDGERGAYWGQAGRWSRRDDGIVDDLAVQRAADGESTPAHPVPLSPPERLRAAALIVAQGGGASQIARRLHVNGVEAAALLAQVKGEGTGATSTGVAA